MKHDAHSLVVGTTADYIEWIECRSRAAAVFLTSSRERQQAHDKYVPPHREILADLNRFEDCVALVQAYIHATGIALVAIACFDDECLLLAATVAQALDLPFPPAAAVRRCLDKQVAKEVWRAHGVPCPAAATLTTDTTALDTAGIAFPCVLKPHAGSGSERVFLCRTPKQAKEAASKIMAHPDDGRTNPSAVAESYVEGHEFSCDFVVSDGAVRVLRTAGKCMVPDAHFGTTLAYILPASLPARVRDQTLPTALLTATASLGIRHAICMVDFMVTDEGVFILEISPRIGGDCLPHILFDAWGIDTLSAVMDFARGAPVKPWLEDTGPTVVGLRVFSPRPGKVVAVDTRPLDDDPRVISHHLDQCRGRTVTLPPEDYATWLLGHVVFQPYASVDVEAQIHELRDRINIRFEDGDA